MSKHTPGPWIYHEQGDANEWCLFNENRNWFMAFRQNGEIMTDTQKANAKLIAAAPDLLQACKLLIDQAEKCGYKTDDGLHELVNNIAIHNIREAIKKATHA